MNESFGNMKISERNKIELTIPVSEYLITPAVLCKNPEPEEISAGNPKKNVPGLRKIFLNTELSSEEEQNLLKPREKLQEKKIEFDSDIQLDYLRFLQQAGGNIDTAINLRYC